MMIECVKLHLRGLDLKVASLTGADLEDHEATLNALLSPNTDAGALAVVKETIAGCAKLLVVACRETHPGLKVEDLRGKIDARNRKAIVDALLGVSAGFEPVEVKAQGEG